MVVNENIGEQLRDMRFNPAPECDEEQWESVAGKTILISMTAAEHTLWRRLEQIIANIADNFTDLQYFVNISGGLVIAYKELTIASGDLTTTVVSNDTLITVSQTDTEFNWNDPRLMHLRSINLEPALGVEPMGFVIDTSAHINPAVLHSVAANGTVTHNLQMDCVSTAPGQPTHLIRRQWVNTGGVWDLDPIAWTVGQTLHLAQLLLNEATELT